MVAAIKPVAPVTGVDWLSGAVTLDERHLERTAADAAACAVALSVAAGLAGRAELLAVCGPRGGTLLAEVAGEGFAAATRVALGDGDPDAADPSEQPDAASVARALADACAGAQVVVCGDASGDVGSGTVPGRLAELLGWAQALGVHALVAHDGELEARRRLDGGHVEHLAVRWPCVVSVVARTAATPRASLRALLAPAGLDVVAAPDAGRRGDPVGTQLGPWRPIASEVPVPTAPPGIHRALEVTGAARHREPSELLALEPAAAARAILARLDEWGIY